MKKKFLNIEETFSLAVENHKKNDFKSAEKFYNEVLKKDSNHFKSIFYFDLFRLNFEILTYYRSL